MGYLTATRYSFPFTRPAFDLSLLSASHERREIMRASMRCRASLKIIVLGARLPAWSPDEKAAQQLPLPDSLIVFLKTVQARTISRGSRDTRRRWRDAGKPEILGIARGLWQRGVGDRRPAAGLVDAARFKDHYTMGLRARERGWNTRKSRFRRECYVRAGYESLQRSRRGEKRDCAFSGFIRIRADLGTRLYCPRRESTRDGITKRYRALPLHAE